MVNIEYLGVNYPIRNTMKEITIEEMEVISYELKQDIKVLDKWFNILEHLGLDSVVIDNIDFDTFAELIKNFDFNTKSPIQKEVEIDGIIYSCYEGDSFKLKMKTLNKILDIMNINQDFFIAKVASVLYTRADYTDQQNNEKEHLKYKEEFFKTQPADLVMDLISRINENIIKKIAVTGGV